MFNASRGGGGGGSGQWAGRSDHRASSPPPPPFPLAPHGPVLAVGTATAAAATAGDNTNTSGSTNSSNTDNSGRINSNNNSGSGINSNRNRSAVEPTAVAQQTGQPLNDPSNSGQPINNQPINGQPIGGQPFSNDQSFSGNGQPHFSNCQSFENRPPPVSGPPSYPPPSHAAARGHASTASGPDVGGGGVGVGVGVIAGSANGTVMKDAPMGRSSPPVDGVIAGHGGASVDPHGMVVDGAGGGGRRGEGGGAKSLLPCDGVDSLQQRWCVHTKSLPNMALPLFAAFCFCCKTMGFHFLTEPLP